MKRREMYLLGVLLFLIAGYGGINAFEFNARRDNPNATQATPKLSGVNKITSLALQKRDDGTYLATVEYFFNGDNEHNEIFVSALVNEKSEFYYQKPTGQLKLGSNRIELQLLRPVFPDESFITNLVKARFVYSENPESSYTVKQTIEWPNFDDYIRLKNLVNQGKDQVFLEAQNQVNKGDNASLEDAQKKLEYLLLRYPDYVMAYHELARISMKTHWNVDGRAAAEQHLLNGLKIDPQSADCLLLLGYVYTHQNRLQEAENSFQKSNSIGTKNLWLWSNWGELLAKQGKISEAVEKYNVVIAGARTFDSNDRARLDAYSSLYNLHIKQKNYNEVDNLLKRRAVEFKNKPCFLSEYARIRIGYFSDYEEAIKNAQSAIEQGCNDKESRMNLAMAYYYKWFAGPAAERDDAYKKASVFLSESPTLYYYMAQYDSTSQVIPKIVNGGLDINSKDARKINALAYALYNMDSDAARRLNDYGADFLTPIGEENFQAAVIPFITQDVDSIKLMKEKKVRFSSLTIKGMPVTEYVKYLDNEKIKRLVLESNTLEL